MADIYAPRTHNFVSDLSGGRSLWALLAGAAEQTGVPDLVRSGIRRRKFRALLRLDQHMLDDIGLSHYDIMRGLELPLRVNAAVEMKKAAAMTRARTPR